MRPATVSRASVGFVACMAAVAIASTALADPSDPIPGNGVFHVGTDIAPGTYHTQGPSNPLILVFGKVSPLSTCSWLTHSTPGAGNDDIVDSNSSMGPMYAKVPATVAAFETTNCQPWTQVS
jgi:hypothetical protein